MPKKRPNKKVNIDIVTKRKLAKLSIPRGNKIVQRARIHNLLKEATQRPVCWLAGPAGSGKTTAVIDYVSATSASAIWYRVDESDNDIASFFYYLAQTYSGRRKKTELPLFTSEYAARPLDFSRRFFRQFFNQLQDNCLLVLDDLHTVQSNLFQSVLATAFTEIPDGINCLCLSRSLPSLEFSSLQVRGQLSVIDQSLLDFTYHEAQALFTDRTLSTAHLQQAYELTQGWAAGLALISDRIQQAERFSPAINNPATQLDSKSLLFYYLANHVFVALPEEQQQFLLHTSLLPEISSDSADELMGREDSGAQLALLYRRQLFISRRGGRDPVYRYHDLLREFLQEQLVARVPGNKLRDLKRVAAKALESRGDISYAIRLAYEAQDWDRVLTILLVHAESMINSGRRETFIHWAKTLPETLYDDQPWLCYWLAMAYALYDDKNAESWFERAYSIFEVSKDDAGLCTSTASALLTRTYSFQSRGDLNRWIERCIELRTAMDQLTEPSTILLAKTGYIRALMFSNKPQLNSQQAGQSCQDMLALLISSDNEIDPNLRLMASQAMVDYAGYELSGTLFVQAFKAVEKVLDDDRVRPWLRAYWLLSVTWVRQRLPDASAKLPYQHSEAMITETLQLAERESLPDIAILAVEMMQRVAKLHNSVDDMAKWVQRMETLIDHQAPLQVDRLRFAQISLLSMQEKYEQAIKLSDEVLPPILGATPIISSWKFLIAHFQLYVGAGRYSQAITFLSAYADNFSGFLRRMIQLYLDLAAAFAVRESSGFYQERLAKCLEALRRENAITVFNNTPALAAKLCADGLRYQIETEFCCYIIEKRNLRAPWFAVAYWPWPVRVYALGGLRIYLKDEAVKFGKKAQRKPLELLKALLCADQEIESKQLIRFLWPELSEQAKTNPLDMTVYRLRKLLGRDDSVSVDEGKIRLNPDVVWSDVAAFEAMTVDTSLAEHGELIERAEQAIDLYQGALFGAGEPEKQWLSTREKLETKFMKLVAELGEIYEQQRKWQQAVNLYQRGLESNNLNEEFYRGMIRCKLALGEVAGAMEIYRRCRSVLSIVLGIVPSKATRLLLGVDEAQHLNP